MTDKGVPEKVVQQIKDHLIEASLIGEDGWEHANQEEDTLTGDYLGQLRTGIKRCGDWKWKIKYNKFRGRGAGAYEKTVGADGIITIEIEKDGIRETKSVIFQAKKEGNRQTAVQIDKMQKALPQGNMVLVFSKDGYFGETGKDFENGVAIEKRAGDYLADVIVGCTNGQWGVDYDAIKNELRILDKKIPFTYFKHKLEIKIGKG